MRAFCISFDCSFDWLEASLSLLSPAQAVQRFFDAGYSHRSLLALNSFAITLLRSNAKELS